MTTMKRPFDGVWTSIVIPDKALQVDLYVTFFTDFVVKKAFHYAT